MKSLARGHTGSRKVRSSEAGVTSSLRSHTALILRFLTCPVVHAESTLARDISAPTLVKTEQRGAILVLFPAAMIGRWLPESYAGHSSSH